MALAVTAILTVPIAVMKLDAVSTMFGDIWLVSFV